MPLTISARGFKSVPPPSSPPVPTEPAVACAVVTACVVKVSIDIVGSGAAEDDVPVNVLVWMVPPGEGEFADELA